MSTPLTEVQIHFLRDILNHRLRFGDPAFEAYVDRRRALAWFKPDAVFGYIRWQNGPYGTALWRLYVLRARAPQETISRVTGLVPGAEILLRVDGTSRVKSALALIDDLEDRGFDPAQVTPDYWHHMHHQLIGGGKPHPYTPDQHSAWLRRREIVP